jgi:hypothetical protein
MTRSLVRRCADRSIPLIARTVPPFLYPQLLLTAQSPPPILSLTQSPPRRSSPHRRQREKPPHRRHPPPPSMQQGRRCTCQRACSGRRRPSGGRDEGGGVSGMGEGDERSLVAYFSLYHGATTKAQRWDVGDRICGLFVNLAITNYCNRQLA